MKELLILSTLFLLVNFYLSETIAQCSDAGICQIGGHSMEDEVLLGISGFYKYGYSGKEDDVQFNSLQLNVSYDVFSKSSIQLLVPYNFQSGPAGSVNGIGDLIASWNQQLFSDENSSVSASLGAKLATGDDNKDNLPQVYQSGLGSNDLLFAVDYTYNNLSFGAGYQVAGKRNDNRYRLKRGDDLLLRASYKFLFDQLTITPQLLFIQRLSKSSIIDFNSETENFIEVENSDQAQLNFLAKLEYEMGKNIFLVGDFAIPFIKREVNVDGLTRAFSASAGVRFSFN